MHRFWELILRPVLEELRPEHIVEIGSQSGAGTKRILELCAQIGGHLHVVDPIEIKNLAEIRPLLDRHGTFHQALSVDALQRIPPAGAYLIDGDHNWYTVWRELELIEGRARAPRPLIVLHDVLWPYGRRDLYYDPSTIPEAYRHPHEKKGMLPNHPELVEEGINPHLFHATTEGGPRNGVLTAVEDFLQAHPGLYDLELIRGIHGLAFLVPRERAEEPFARRIHAFTRLPDSARTLLELVESDRLDMMASAHRMMPQLLELKARIGELTAKAASLQRENRRLSMTLDSIVKSRGYRALTALRKAKRRILER